MPRLNLIQPSVYGGSASESPEGAMQLFNVFVDTLGGVPTIKRRPGLILKHDLGEDARVDVFWWEAKRYMIMCCGGKIFYKKTESASPVDITPVSGSLGFNTRVLFSADEYGVTMSTGRGLFWWNGSDANAYKITDGNAPDSISSLTYLKGYTIASITSTQEFAYALYEATDSRTLPPPWNPLTLSASSQPDDIICMKAGWEELFFLGRESGESKFVTGDATVPFQTLSGSISETGIINARVLQKLLNTWIFMTPNRDVVMLEGRSPVVISGPIRQAMWALDNFTDVEAYVLFERFYVLNFRSENQTFVFDVQTKLWYRWEFWDTTYKRYVKFLGVTAAHAKSWEKHFVGGFDGKLYQVDYSTATDNGTLIRCKILTGHIDHGTLDRKFARELKLRMKRGG